MPSRTRRIPERACWKRGGSARHVRRVIHHAPKTNALGTNAQINIGTIKIMSEMSRATASVINASMRFDYS
jgi:hypothetical protein